MSRFLGEEAGITAEAGLSAETALRVVQVFRRALDEVEAILKEDGLAGLSSTISAASSAGAASAPVSTNDEVWSLGDVKLSGGWEFDRSEHGLSCRWGDGQLSEFEPVDIYNGTGDFDGITLGLGYEANGNVVGLLSPGPGARGLTVFFPAHDFADSNEKLSMIRGGGDRGRSGFGVGDSLPPAYDGFEIQMLRDRIPGKWHRQAVVADADDHQTMLAHTALQARLRGLA